MEQMTLKFVWVQNDENVWLILSEHYCFSPKSIHCTDGRLQPLLCPSILHRETWDQSIIKANYMLKDLIALVVETNLLKRKRKTGDTKKISKPDIPARPWNARYRRTVTRVDQMKFEIPDLNRTDHRRGSRPGCDRPSSCPPPNPSGPSSGNSGKWPSARELDGTGRSLYAGWKKSKSWHQQRCRSRTTRQL